MTNAPSGLLFDHACRLRVLPSGASCIGGAARGVRSIGTRRGAPQSKALYCELRRLTMRGELLSIVRLARKLALASSSPASQRARFLGRSGGKGP